MVYYTPIRTAKKITKTISNAGEDSEKLDLSHTTGGNVNGIATLEIHLAGFFACFKIKHTITI